MRASTFVLGAFIFAALALPTASQNGKDSRLSPKLLAAKSAYFEDRTRAAHVTEKALEQLQKWGRFRIVADRKEADLIILLSADPYKGGFNKLAPVRYAYLTVIDPKTGEDLWSESHQWGGLLTGFDSVGERLVKKLEKQMK